MSSDKFREKHGYLSDELEDSSQMRSVSPMHRDSNNGSRSSRSRRTSRSPRSSHSNMEKSNNSTTLGHSSRPEIAAWPAPPPPSALNMKPVAKTNPVRPTPSSFSALGSIYDESTNNFSEDSAKFFSMLKVAAASSANRGKESELRKKIQTLEETVAEYERQKYSVMGTFTEYRERVAERERKLEAEYSNKIIALSEEVLSAKKDFEARMKSFQALQEKFEREKEQALDKMRQEHQKEIQVLEQRFSASQLINLEQKYIIEIQRLEEERKSLKNEKERLGETFEMKLRRAQSLYETELTAAKMLYTKELEALRDHEEALKEELAARQEEFHDRLQELELQAQQSKDEVNCCRQDVSVLERKLRTKEREIVNISKDLTAASVENKSALQRLECVTSKMDKINDNYKLQQEDLQHKAELLTAAENTKVKLENTIKELQMEVKALKNKVEFLEKERENLQSQSESQTQLHNSQVKALEAVLESLTKEKDSTKEHYEKLLEHEREQAEEREYSMKKEFSTKLNEIEEQYNSLREHLEASETFGPENVKLWAEIESLRSEKTSLEDEVSALRTQLHEVGEHDSHQNLDYVIELLRAIESVKYKVHKGSSEKFSTPSKSKENSIELENNILDVDVSSLKQQLCQEISGNTSERSADLELILRRLQELEASLDEIIEEKDEAQQKVESLSVENQRMMEKIEAFEKAKLSAAGDTDSEELQKLLTEHQQKIDMQNNKIIQLQDELEECKSKLDESSQHAAQEVEAARQQAQQEISELNEKLETVFHERDQLRVELDEQLKVIQELNSASEKALREMEESYEKRISEMQENEAKTRQEVVELQEKVDRLQALINDTEQQKKKNDDTTDNQVQTDEREQPAIDENKVKILEDLIEHLKAEIELKNKQIETYHEAGHSNQNKEDESELDTELVEQKESRSHSLTNEEPVQVCHKNMFQSFVSQMTDKKDRRDSKSSIDSKKAEKAEKKKEKEQQKEAKKQPTNSSLRPKSPSLLTRLRDRSPSKTKFASPEPTSPSHSKNLLSPADADDAHHRRASPSRQLFSRKAKEESVPHEKSEKRPAWKF